jgi:hypothetical protein
MAKSEEKRHEPRRGWLKYGNPSGDFNKAPRCTLNRSKLLQVSPVDPEIFAITAFVFPSRHFTLYVYAGLACCASRPDYRASRRVNNRGDFRTSADLLVIQST